MTADFPYDDDTPTFDVIDAEPPSLDTDAEPVIVPPPSQAVTTKPLPVPRARRQLKAEVDAIKEAMATLKKRGLGEAVQLTDLAIDALVCATLDLQLPLDADNPHIGRRREAARQEKLTAYIPLAMDELEDALATLEAALAALKAISVLDEPIPTEWATLLPSRWRASSTASVTSCYADALRE